ncbi:MAG TPA: hypothetical protein VF511_07210, partial [Chthoniobacterales bacterium]
GGTIASAALSTAASSNLYFQDAPFTFSGINNFTGAGQHGFFNNTVTLADAATTLNVTNLSLAAPPPLSGGCVVSGPGTVNVSGGLIDRPWPTTISGAHLITAAGSSTRLLKGGEAPFQFTNGATWVNSGTITSEDINVIDGAADTHFTNTGSGILRTTAGPYHILQMPFDNSGVFDIAVGTLRLTRNGTFKNGSSVTIASGWQMWLRSIALNLEDTSNVSGLGFMNVDSSSLAFVSGAKLNAERIVFNGNSSANGAGGELNVSKDLQLRPVSATQTFDATQINLASGGVGTIQFDTGTLRLQNGAHLTNGGNLTFSLAGTTNLTTDRPGWSGNGTETLKTLNGSRIDFNSSATVSWPFDFAGAVWAQGSSSVTFNKGGLFNDAAKFITNGGGTEFKFSGATPYHSRGKNVELNGTGYLFFDGTTLQLDGADPNAPQNDPAIAAGARILLDNGVTIKGVGTLSLTTGVTFRSGDTVIERTTLQTLPNDPNDPSVGSGWTFGNSLTLKDGAKILNQGLFSVAGPFTSWTTNNGGLFHNMATGRFVHDANATSNIGIPFLNEGFFEFKKGTVNFTAGYSGNGGVAVSGGSKVDLGSTAFTDPSNLPKGLQASGVGSQLKLTLATGQVYNVENPDALKAAAGGNVTVEGGATVQVTAAPGVNVDGANSVLSLPSASMVAAGAG